MPYFRCALLPPPSGTLPPLQMRVPAEVLFGFDQEHVGPRFSRDDRGRETRRAGADHDDVGLTIPAPRRPRSLVRPRRARRERSRRRRRRPSSPIRAAKSCRAPSPLVLELRAQRRAIDLDAVDEQSARCAAC